MSFFSMFPLFVKDDLVLHYFSTLLLFYVVVGITFNLTPNQPSKNQFLPWIYPLLPYMVSFISFLIKFRLNNMRASDIIKKMN